MIVSIVRVSVRRFEESRFGQRTGYRNAISRNFFVFSIGAHIRRAKMLLLSSETMDLFASMYADLPSIGSQWSIIHISCCLLIKVNCIFHASSMTVSY